MKRGMTGLQLIGTLIIGLVVVGIVVSAFAGDILKAAVSQAIGAGFGALPEERPPEFEGQVIIPRKLRNYYDELIKHINTPPPGDNCIKYVAETQETDEYIISLSNNLVQVERSGRGGLSVGIDPKIIDGFEPCIVIGEGALNFYNKFIEDPPKYSGNKLFRSGEYGSDSKFRLRKDRYSKFLFKQGENLCLIKFYEGRCETPRNNGDDGIPTGCEDEIEKINICE